MRIHWPIFVRETSGFMSSFKDPEDVAGLERYDVEEMDRGWDSDGQPLSLHWDDTASKARARAMPGLAQPGELRDAIIRHARVFNPQEPFQPDETDPSKLLLLAEAHARRNCWLARADLCLMRLVGMVAGWLRRGIGRKNPPSSQD